jgi:hypothetical protein
VVAPRPLENQRRKHQKTDRLDGRALLDNLESYLPASAMRGASSRCRALNRNSNAQWCVSASSSYAIDAEPRRGGRALALAQGILAPVGWWRPAAWKQFKTQLPQWTDSQVEQWQEEALGVVVDAKERQVRRELENMVSCISHNIRI